jgi:hypothetical protein
VNKSNPIYRYSIKEHTGFDFERSYTGVRRGPNVEADMPRVGNIGHANFYKL